MVKPWCVQFSPSTKPVTNCMKTPDTLKAYLALGWSCGSLSCRPRSFTQQPAEASLKRQLDEDGRSLSAEKNRQRAATVLKAKLQGDRSWQPFMVDHV